MKKLHKDRLLKLAEFLEKLPRKKFYFGSVVKGTEMPRKELNCGSTACAVGWCPVVFPRLVKYRDRIFFENGDFNVKTNTSHGYSAVAQELFGIDRVEADALFTPGCGPEAGLVYLTSTATPKAVAKNIRRFVVLKSKP